MYKSFVVIGIGTLGGFLAESLSKLDTTEEIALVDFDTVEWKNLKNSVYRPIDVGLKKTQALADIIVNQNTGIIIKSIECSFVECYTDLPHSDIIFDCRDIICDRKNIIDVRASISSRYLIVDCRKNVSYKEQKEGKYLVTLEKDDIRNAAFILSMLVSNGSIRYLIQTQAIQKYELDYLKKVDTCQHDLIYDSDYDSTKLINLPLNAFRILEENKKQDVNVFVGSKDYPMAQTKIPKNTLKSYHDVVVNFNSLINIPCAYPSYIIAVNPNGYVELIPETGAA